MQQVVVPWTVGALLATMTGLCCLNAAIKTDATTLTLGPDGFSGDGPFAHAASVGRHGLENEHPRRSRDHRRMEGEEDGGGDGGTEPTAGREGGGGDSKDEPNEVLVDIGNADDAGNPEDREDAQDGGDAKHDSSQAWNGDTLPSSTPPSPSGICSPLTVTGIEQCPDWDSKDVLSRLLLAKKKMLRGILKALDDPKSCGKGGDPSEPLLLVQKLATDEVRCLDD